MPSENASNLQTSTLNSVFDSIHGDLSRHFPDVKFSDVVAWGIPIAVVSSISFLEGYSFVESAELALLTAGISAGFHMSTLDGASANAVAELKELMPAFLTAASGSALASCVMLGASVERGKPLSIACVPTVIGGVMGHIYLAVRGKSQNHQTSDTELPNWNASAGGS